MINRWRFSFRHSILMVLGLFFSSALMAQEEALPQENHEERYENTLLLTTVMELVREQYVDPSKVSYQRLTEAALEGILSSLDPHSEFLDEEEFQEMQKETRGEFSGLGLVVGMKEGQLIVISPIEGSPAHRAGILPGDRILKINKKSTEKITLSQAVKLMRGPQKGKVSLAFLRKKTLTGPQEDIAFEAELVRETIRVTTVRDAKLLSFDLTGDKKIGYIRLEQFSGHTAEEFEKALEQLEAQDMEALVLDLRNNPGGILDAAVAVTGSFLEPGQLIVSTEGRHPSQRYEYRAHGMKPHPCYPMAVLINGYSASGSEIVAGALQDFRRAILLGETTFGKGSVQTVQHLGGGVGLRLTTAKYYTPQHRMIHEVGVKPDILIPISEEEEHALLQARASQYLSEKEKQALLHFRDTQLERAVDALKGVCLYTERQSLLAWPQQAAMAP